jgi:acetate---CoA ligase (ADP-forming)
MADSNGADGNHTNLDIIFNPRSVAVIGASRDPVHVGNGILKNLLEGGVFKTEYCRPFKGAVYAINPKADSILGVKCHASILDVPGDVDLAVVCIPAKLVAKTLDDCGKKNVKGAVIITAGFAELGGEKHKDGVELQRQVVEAAKKNGIRVIGPNCLGIIRTPSALNASFAPSMPKEGNVAFISQSGALVDSVLDWAIEKGYGFSTVVSYGNKCDLDIHDFINWLDKDTKTGAIALYVEGIDKGREFMQAAEKATVKTPVILLKAGRTSKGAKAISSHTGSLAGSYEVIQAACKQTGVILADSITEMFHIAKALANQPPCKTNAVAIITNAGGPGVLCADYCDSYGINLVNLTEETLKKLDDSGKMHPAYSRANPLDLVGDALPDRYNVAIETLLSENYIGGLIVIQTLQTMTDPLADANIVIAARKKYPEKPIVCCFMGGKFTGPSNDLLEANGIPNYDDPKKAALAMKSLIDRGVKK